MILKVVYQRGRGNQIIKVIIYLTNIPYTLPLGRSCKYMLNGDLSYFAVWPNPAFQPIVETHVLYVYVVHCLFRRRYQGVGRRYMPYRHEKHSMQKPCQNGLFLSKIQLNITKHVFKMKVAAYNNSVITHFQRFICVCTNSCIPDSQVRTYTDHADKSLNSCHNPKKYLGYEQVGVKIEREGSHKDTAYAFSPSICPRSTKLWL